LQPNPPGQPLKCQVVSWRYQVGKTDADSRLEVTLREIKKPWFSRLSPDSQFVAGMIPAVLTVVLGVTAWLLFSQYPAPQEIWVFVGRHIRGLVGWALFLGSVVLALAIRNALSSERETWRGMYLNVLLPALGLGAWAYWMYVSEPPQPLTGAPGEYIAYLNYLVSGAKTAWPMLLSAVPWAVFLFKLLGLEVLGKFDDTFIQHILTVLKPGGRAAMVLPVS